MSRHLQCWDNFIVPKPFPLGGNPDSNIIISSEWPSCLDHYRLALDEQKYRVCDLDHVAADPCKSFYLGPQRSSNNAHTARLSISLSPTYAIRILGPLDEPLQLAGECQRSRMLSFFPTEVLIQALAPVRARLQLYGRLRAWSETKFIPLIG